MAIVFLILGIVAIVASAAYIRMAICRLNNVPQHVLKTIQSSINPRKGKIGELVALMEIKGEYNTIIPLGQPIDMIGISDDGIDFIEIKTGDSRLTANEKSIKDLIEAGKVGFRCIRYTVDVSDEGLEVSNGR